MADKNTSWEKVAGWYDRLLDTEGTYQKDLVLPNLLRLMDLKKSDRVLDLACGQGFFAREFYKSASIVYGVDLSPSLIRLAEKNSPKSIQYKVSPASSLPFIPSRSIDKISIILALQNIEDANAVLKECGRVLADGGQIFIVLNHPGFRIPKASSWGWDEKESVQYRRIDEYISESKVKIQMHPGDRPDRFTTSFHRPLQFFFKAFRKAGLVVSNLEEWTSHRKSQPGPRAKAEDKARKEIPLFMCMVASKK